MGKKGIVVAVAFLLFALLCGPVGAGDALFEAAPLSEAFLEYRDSVQADVESAGREASGHPAGYVPSPVDLSHLRGADYSSYLNAEGRGADPIPATYDLRQLGYVTPVKDQGNQPSCWAFSAMGAMESNYMKQNPGKTIGLSAQHLYWYAFKESPYFMDGNLNGGFDNMAIAMLARWSGPVLESQVPYGTTPQGPSSKYVPALHLQNAYFMNLQFEEEQPQPSNEIRKRLIMEHGAISAGCYASDVSYYNSVTQAWNCTVSKRPDHAILIVGWDDYFPRAKFRQMPTMDGAWLVKNSWGDNWGDSGYYWLSYADRSFLDGVAYIVEAADNYDNNYGYDDLGWCRSMGGNATAWMANVFVAAQTDETLEAVAFYTTAADAGYEVFVYTDIPAEGDPTSGMLAATSTGRADFSGYHTVKLDAPVLLEQGTRFAVVAKMTTPGYNYPLAVEAPVSGYSDAAVSNAGESFFSADGSNWQDGRLAGQSTFQNANLNACIRAFTKTADASSAYAFSENPADWGKVLVETGANVFVRLYARVLTDTLPTEINVKVGGMTPFDAFIGDAQGAKVSGAPGVSVSRAADGERYLIVEGSASSLSAANNATIDAVSYKFGGLTRVQYADAPLRLADMSARDPGPNDYSGNQVSGGSSGCSAGIGSFVLALAVSGLLLRKRRAS